MSMYGSRGYRGFHDRFEYADWRRKNDREEALIERGEPNHRVILSDWNEDTRRYDTATIVDGEQHFAEAAE